MRYNKTFIS
jgi:hypothetical protein